MTRTVCRVFVAVFACVTLWHCTACKTHGHRKLTVGLFGQVLVIEDQAFLNEEGEQTYKVTFDDTNSIVGLLFGWLNPDEENAETVEVEGGDEPAEVNAQPGTG